MTQVPRWVQELTEETLGGPPVKVGGKYVHPEHGPIEILSGQYWGERGLSNHWTWRELPDGPKHHGYASNWPEYTPD